MISFILNNRQIQTSLPTGMAVLDFIRYEKHLKGTKIGCREGDCGACTVLVGDIVDDQLRYRSMTSCLMPLGNAHGKHIVTVEGVNMEELNPVQQAMADEGGTQCGFCTPGFIMSLAGFVLKNTILHPYEEVISAIDGNICRCTGYKSIERAAFRIADMMSKRSADVTPAEYAATNKILPDYFKDIYQRLSILKQNKSGAAKPLTENYIMTGGGTDLYVQRHDTMTEADMRLTLDDQDLKGIYVQGENCFLGASTTVTDLLESPVIRNAFPDFENYAKLVSSTPIRNMATIAGNFVNASPIGDFTAFFLALESNVFLSDGKSKREVPLNKFYKGYKTLDKATSEFIEQICFKIPDKGSLFNFEKVSKRTNLDIASVNSAILLDIENDKITHAGISAGGVGPIPTFLFKTCEFLKGKELSGKTVHKAIEVAQSEVSPISDSRGTEEYKRLLLSQLLKAHFIKFNPALEQLLV